MIILTSATRKNALPPPAGYSPGHWKISFQKIIMDTVREAERNHYTPIVYDLGELGFGEKFLIDDSVFLSTGFYQQEARNGYKTKALFKPEVIRHSLATRKDFTVYLDADAQLMGNIDEVATEDYDVGVTLRERFEIESDWHRKYFEIVKYINAGVILFNPTPATFRFVDRWFQTTQDVGNDQMALNQLICPDRYPEAFSIQSINGLRVKFFPCAQYNYYYFKEIWVPDIKIMHFKGNVRNFYPFDWKRRLGCRFIIPLIHRFRSHKIR